MSHIVKLLKRVNRIRRWMNRAPYIYLVLAIGLTFWTSYALTPVYIPPKPENIPDIDVECRGPWSGIQVTQDQLDQIISKHKEFLARAISPVPMREGPYTHIKGYAIDSMATPQGKANAFPPSIKGAAFDVSDDGRADLCGARLSNLDFRGADLRYARFMGARFENVNLDGADLKWAHFRRAGFLQVHSHGYADFYDCDFTGAIIGESDMSKWDFRECDFSYAEIFKSNFTYTIFDNVNMSAANLFHVGLKGATFRSDTLIYTRLDIKPGELPDINSLRDVKGLTSLQTYAGSETVLIELREQLKKASFNLQASEVNFAINKFSKRNEFPGKQVLHDILFGVTYAYGMKPERPLLTGILLIPVFAMFYIITLYRYSRSKRDGIWVIRNPPKLKPSRNMLPIGLRRRDCNPITTGIWFSVLSAFRIGWHEFNIGDWIARVQYTDYKLEAQGWTRSAAGIQSLISVYLLALAIASYLST